MNSKVKIFEIALALIILVGISSIPLTSPNQTASVGFLFGSNNKNETVLKAQAKLTELGLYEGNISGLFGLRTRFAIYRFQEIKGLSKNGILDIPTQKTLFSVEEPEYLLINYTEYGNTYIFDWMKYYLGESGNLIEISGQLTQSSETNDFTLNGEDGNIYGIKNISSRDLAEFNGKNVTLKGILSSENNSLGFPIVFINYLEAGEEISVTTISFSEEGNEHLKDWVNTTYGESHDFQGFSGNYSLGQKVQYAPGGNKTRSIITLLNGTKYNIENISSLSMDAFIGKDIMIRGLLLNNLNSLGLKTIVINYILPI